MVRRLVSGAVAFVLALGGVVFASAPASANLPPGDPSTWGVVPSLSALGSCSAQSSGNLNSVGGWDRRSHYLTGAATAPPSGGKVEPFNAVLGELCIGPNSRLAVAHSEYALVNPLTGNDRFATGSITINSIECVNSSNAYRQWTNGTVISRLFGGGQAVTLNRVSEFGVTPQSWVNSNCVRLIAISGTVVRDLLPGSTATTSVRWSAAAFLGNAEYTNEPPDGAVEYCLANPDALFCDVWAPPSPVSWEDTCGDAANSDVYGIEYATYNPVDAATWGPATAWLGACLFVPLPDVGGFDRTGVVAAAWEDSPNVEVGEQLSTLSGAWAFAPGCGVLASTGAGGPLAGFTIDTCAWTWASPVRAVLAIAVLVGGFWFFITYTVRAVSGLVRKNVPSPVEGAE